jgi:hypothetical protein
MKHSLISTSSQHEPLSRIGHNKHFQVVPKVCIHGFFCVKREREREEKERHGTALPKVGVETIPSCRCPSNCGESILVLSFADSSFVLFAFHFRKSFRFPIITKNLASVTHVHFAEESPHDFAVTSSSRVFVYSTASNQVKRNITRFKDVAYGGTLRDDGKLLLAGGEHPVVKVFVLSHSNIPH